jgi:hypothetical protein
MMDGPNPSGADVIAQCSPAALPEAGSDHPLHLHFRRIGWVRELAPLIAEIRQNRELWNVDQRRQRSIDVHAETNSIYLRHGVREPGVEIRKEDIEVSAMSPAWDRFPNVTRVMTDLASQEGGEVGRAMVVRLKPQGKVYGHIDFGSYYAHRDRYHLVIQSPSGSEMKCEDECAVFRQGEVFCFNNKVRHEAFNASNDWRIHLIFDLLPIGRPLYFQAKSPEPGFRQRGYT